MEPEMEWWGEGLGGGGGGVGVAPKRIWTTDKGGQQWCKGSLSTLAQAWEKSIGLETVLGSIPKWLVHQPPDS